LFPLAAHTYLGFTTQDPGHLVANYGSFIHLRGKIETQRNTDTIFRFWKSTSGLPDLYVHFYWQKTGGIDYPGWLSDGNVHVRMGWMDRTEYLNLAKLHGIHLCTSEVEGFGHYINEARAMGSLVITTDGAPMNELIDDTSGILVRPASTSKQNWGVKYGITPEDLAPAIERILSLSPKARHDLGTAARERFLTEDRWFRQRALDLFSALR
jgi:glycosyltransferase involved in cell wall biosynthesis